MYRRRRALTRGMLVGHRGVWSAAARMGATESTARAFAVRGFTSADGAPVPKDRWAGMVEQHLHHVYTATDGSFDKADDDVNRISADFLLDGLAPCTAPAPLLRDRAGPLELRCQIPQARPCRWIGRLVCRGVAGRAKLRHRAIARVVRAGRRRGGFGSVCVAAQRLRVPAQEDQATAT